MSTVDQSLRAFKERESQIDVEAKTAVENFQSASAPIVDFFSTTEAIFEERMTVLTACTARLTQRLPIMREVSAKLRNRLLDPRPFSARDVDLIESAAKSTWELANVPIVGITQQTVDAIRETVYDEPSRETVYPTAKK